MEPALALLSQLRVCPGEVWHQTQHRPGLDLARGGLPVPGGPALVSRVSQIPRGLGKLRS